MSEEVAPSLLLLVADIVSNLESYKARSTVVLKQLVGQLTEIERKEGSSRQEVISDALVWICLAGLCVMSSEIVAGMAPSSDAAGPSELCENHDDDETGATHACVECGLNLCVECERVLHCRAASATTRASASESRRRTCKLS